MDSMRKVKKIPLSEYLKKGDLTGLIHFLKNREKTMIKIEKELQDRAADLALKEEGLKRKTGLS